MVIKNILCFLLIVLAWFFLYTCIPVFYQDILLVKNEVAFIVNNIAISYYQLCLIILFLISWIYFVYYKFGKILIIKQYAFPLIVIFWFVFLYYTTLSLYPMMFFYNKFIPIWPMDFKYFEINFVNYFFFQISNYKLFFNACIIYFIVQSIYYLYAEEKPSRPVLTLSLIKKYFTFTLSTATKTEKSAFMNVLIKFIFVPLMFMWIFENGWNMLHSLSNMINYINTNYENFYYFYWNNLHWFLLSTILLVDVVIFTVWYMVELKSLKNEIKTIDPSLIWWISVLLCYPVTNTITSLFITDLDKVKEFGSVMINLWWSVFYGLVFLVFMSLYAWSSVALMFKASNLTNRGIVDRWPYKYVRHPAYVWKNMAWIIWFFPILINYILQSNYKMSIIIVFSTIVRILIYHLRAVTEEQHLLQDSDYVAYKNKVKYRYIPGII